MGRRRKARGLIINGILLLDKPAGCTSNQALQAAKRLLNAQKAGHTGSLDPLATGLLPLCFGQATKVSSYLLGADKCYEVDIKLGETTTSGDSDGDLLERLPVDVEAQTLQQVLQSFVGTYAQTPPMYSALKHNGVPLYKLARQGIEVPRAARQVTTYRVDLLVFLGDRLRLAVHCSSGYYIRSLTEDIGAALGCGAHVTDLRRTQVGKLELSQAISLAQLEALDAEQQQAHLYPSDFAVLMLPKVVISENAVFYLLRGQAVRSNDAKEQGEVRIYDEDDVFLGLGEIRERGYVAPKRLMVDLPS